MLGRQVPEAFEASSAVHASTAAVPVRAAPVYLCPCPPGRLRRAVDIVGSLILIFLLLPLFLIIAVCVKASSPGPAIYQQTRVGINRRSGRDQRRTPRAPGTIDRRRGDRRVIASAGRLFRIMKFRTMKDGAESTLGPTWAAKNDGRVTSVGRFLRRTRLDELPQLFNVLYGDMSFIGPRPERPFFVEQFRRVIPGYMERLTVPPGITGLAQVEHKYDSTVDDVRLKVEFDLRYLRTRGALTDFRILLKTVRVVLSGSGAH
jgi:lipopolysaccharide/colanic/teichoic acid biosynthesis glycosyltransferase